MSGGVALSLLSLILLVTRARGSPTCAGIQMEALRREIERKRKSSALIRPDT
eukprot:COSAG01_NODE_43719_length_426_cov_824.357798_2_plen_51_part_01